MDRLPNVDKTQMIQFSFKTKEISISVTFNNSNIEHVPQAKFGLYLDETITWKKKLIDVITNKINSFNYTIKLIKECINLEAAKSACPSPMNISMIII